MIIPDIITTYHKGITASHYLDEGFRGAVRQLFGSEEIMDGANDIIVYIMFDAWIRKIRRTSLKWFGTIRQKILHRDLLHCFL